jgi:hypothetical protein
MTTSKIYHTGNAVPVLWPVVSPAYVDGGSAKRKSG